MISGESVPIRWPLCFGHLGKHVEGSDNGMPVGGWQCRHCGLLWRGIDGLDVIKAQRTFDGHDVQVEGSKAHCVCSWSEAYWTHETAEARAAQDHSFYLIRLVSANEESNRITIIERQR